MNKEELYNAALIRVKASLTFTFFGVTQEDIELWTDQISDPEIKSPEMGIILKEIRKKLPQSHDFVIRVEHQILVKQRQEWMEDNG